MYRVIPVWQQIGQSTHQIAMAIGEQFGEKAAHTGTLDPMAEGVVVILAGEARFDKDQLSETKKAYQVQVLVGVSTDTHDLLGLVQKVDMKPPSKVKPLIGPVQEVIRSLAGTINQRPPRFSAIQVEGKPLHVHATQGSIDKVELPVYQRTVYDIQLSGLTTIPKAFLASEIERKISLVQGEFRQGEILARWQEVLPDLFDKLPVFTFKLVTGRGFYVRALVRDLGTALGIPMTVFSLVRIKNGQYSRKDCVSV